MGAVWALCALQVCGAGYVLDLQLPGGSAHVVLLSLLLLLANLKEQAATLLGPADSGSAKVLLRLPVQVRRGTGLRLGAGLAKAITRHVLTLAASRRRLTSCRQHLVLFSVCVPQGRDADSGHTVSSQLRSLSGPFVPIEPVPPTALAAGAAPASGSSEAACEELHFVAEPAAVAAWLNGTTVSLVLGQLSMQQGPQDGLVACQEDAQRETKCRQAMMSVQTFEANAAIDPGAVPQGLLPQRAAMVRLLLASTTLLDMPEEVGHDAVQLLDRLLASPSVGALAARLSGPALTAACLHVVSRQDLAAVPACAAAFNVQPQELLLAENQVQQVLGSRGCVAISAMRVLHLLLERLAVDNRNAAATLQASGQAVAVINRAALVPAFIGCPPSVMAASVLYAARLGAGLLPAWPVSLAALTGYAETHASLQPFIQAAMQLVLEA